MIVSITLGWIIIVLLSIAGLVATRWVIVKKIKEEFPGIHSFPFIIAFCVGFVVYSRTKTVIEVPADGSEIKTSMVFFRATYTATDGQVIKVRYRPEGSTFIVNATSRLMFLETIYYGEPPITFGFSNEPDSIPPNTCKVTFDAPYYYPADFPPDEISVRQSTRSEIRYWLRFE